MKHLYLNQDITREHFAGTLDFINQNSEDTINIILDNNGGSSHLAQILVSIINRNPEKFLLTSVKAYSSGFTIFYAAKCAKQIVRNTMGCYHLSYISIDINSRNKAVWTGERVQLKNFVNEEKKAIALDFMTAREKKKFRKGEDVYFNFERMKEIFPGAEII